MTEFNENIDYRELLQNSIDNNLGIYIEKLNDCNVRFCELAVHDVRVRIRRFLTLLSLIKSISNLEIISEISTKLKGQIKLFNPLRDVQVQLLKIQQMVYTFPVLYRYYHHLLDKEEDCIATLKTQIRQFDINSFNKMILKLKVELNKFYNESTVIETRPQDIAYEKYNIVIAKFNLSNPNDVKSIHKVRLNFKKFRYIMEIIRPIIQPFIPMIDDNIQKDIFSEMNEFQTVMGNIQDLSVMFRKLIEFAETQETVSKEMFKPVESELNFERETRIKEFYSNFDKFYSFWKNEYLR